VRPAKFLDGSPHVCGHDRRNSSPPVSSSPSLSSYFLHVSSAHSPDYMARSDSL
jgi:hypothetical protein